MMDAAGYQGVCCARIAGRIVVMEAMQVSTMNYFKTIE